MTDRQSTASQGEARAAYQAKSPRPPMTPGERKEWSPHRAASLLKRLALLTARTRDSQRRNRQGQKVRLGSVRMAEIGRLGWIDTAGSYANGGSGSKRPHQPRHRRPGTTARSSPRHPADRKFADRLPIDIINAAGLRLIALGRAAERSTDASCGNSLGSACASYQLPRQVERTTGPLDLQRPLEYSKRCHFRSLP